FITGATALAFPKLMGEMIDASKESSIDDINRIALILLVVFIFQSIASYFRIYTFSYVTEKALGKMRLDVYQHVIKLPMTFFSSRRVGELNSRISSDVELLNTTFTITIAELLRQLIIIIGGVIFLSTISGKLTLGMLSIVPVVAVSAVLFGKYIKGFSKQTQAKIAESNVIVEETFTGIANVKSFANERFEIARYAADIKEVIALAINGAKWRGAFASFIIFCIFGSIVAVVWYGAILVQGNELTMGELISFILYTVFMGASIGGIATQYAQIQKAVGATENLMDLLDEKAENINTETLNSIQINGDIEYCNVSFNYPSRQDVTVLKDVSFSAKSGQLIAVVGPSGAGKSTMTSLLFRFYDPKSGSIKIDNKPITDYSITELRNEMAIVPQDVILFGGTIKENIAYGKPGATLEEIQLAAEQANAKEFIDKFPEQYETIVGERGVQLSGGQRQRIAIARAVLKNPSILILDEATSSLDSKSEKLVQNALEKLMKNRTSIVIAHRLSTIRKADKILVLENGEIKESGTHGELIANNKGTYRHLSDLQFELS
ncbi:MAG: ABC transporter ATP-binding protein, partial [Flavobacteriales bacterium]|nr:ABC transporter ATP-binding protein [Flavobacteriales bacterium]